MSVKLLRGATLHCPACGKPQEGKVEDFVVPGRIGSSSEAEDECDGCNAAFSVTCVAVDQFEVVSI